MTKTRASLLTINSLTALSKVCSSSSIKPVALLRNLSTATERWELEAENSNGFSGETQNPVDFSGQGLNLNPSGGFRERAGRKLDRPSGSLGGFSGVDYLSSRSYQNFGGDHYGDNHRSGNQNYPVEGNGNFGRDQGFRQNMSEIRGSNSWAIRGNSNSDGGNGNAQNLEWWGKECRGEVTLDSSEVNGQGFSESRGNIGSSCAQNFQEFRHTPSNHYIVNAGMNQHSSGHGQYWHNGNVPEYQQSVNGGQYWSNLNSIQNSEVIEDPKPRENRVESSEDGSLRSAVDELDDFCKEGRLKEAVEILKLLEKQRVYIDMPRFLKLLEACGEAQALEEARVVHGHICRFLSPSEVSVYNKILETYSKCGAMDEAFAVFNGMQLRNLTSWDTMITWLARNGLGEDAIDLFSQFKQAGLKPDAQMFDGVFSACDVLGDINEGMLHFESMTKDYGIIPLMDNYKSIVDMLGSNGYLDEAFEFIEKMPMEPSVDIWESLMKLCRIHGHLQLGDRCAELVRKLDPFHLDEQSKAGLVPVKASVMARDKEEKKLANQNSSGVRSRVHEYRAGDTSHPESARLYALLRCLKEQMKEAGYIPETRFVLHDVDQESKEEAIHAHSERLATAEALLKSPARSDVRIIKNLRVCGDCHNAIKIISKLVGRKFIMRDAKRFHHVEDGVCSCRDYW